MIKIDNNDRSLHDKFVNYGINVKVWMNKCVLLLPEIAKRRIWEKKGFSSIYEYAAKLAGMSHAKVDEALWILRKVEDKPELQKIVEIKGIQSIKPVVAIATAETAKFWAEKAQEMSRDTLRIFVKELKKQSSEDLRASPKTSPNLFDQQAIFDKEIIVMELNKNLAEKLKKLKGISEWNDLLQQLIDIREKQLELKKQKIIEPAQCKSKTISRHIPNAIKQHILNKTNSTCAFPKCYKNGKILHHTQRFVHQKTHDPNKIVYLCKAHERLSHLGLIENENLPPEKWKIREKPDTEYFNSGKYLIDKIVNKFRNKFVNLYTP